MKKISDCEKTMMFFGIAVLVLFAVSIIKTVSYSVVLADRSLWDSLTIYKTLGVEAAYVFSHCNDSFASMLILKLVEWSVCSATLGALLAFGVIVPLRKWPKEKRQKEK